MILVDPSTAWRTAFLEMAADYAAAGEHRYAGALDDFDAYLQGIDDRNRAERWLEDRGLLIACVRIRFKLTPELEREGGHIGYDVRPTMRRQGHGTALLALALVEAKAFGIDRVLITCDADNLASQKVIERNGGQYAGSAVSEESSKLVRRYWIDR